MDPLSPFKSASAFQSPWSSSASPSSPTGQSNSRHRATNSNGSATGYRSSPLPQSASTPGGFGGTGGMGGMTSGASAWGGEEVYSPAMGNGGASSAVESSAGRAERYDGDTANGPSTQVARQQQQQQQQQYFLRVKITGIERNRKDMLLRFDASTNLPNYRTTIYRNMQRSYAEFQRFAEQAQATSPQTIISALPLASSSALTDEEDDRLVRIALQRWFSRICEDPVLMRDEELRNFVESDFGYSPTPPPSARRAGTSTSAVPSVLSAALSKVVKRGPLEEDDELASAKAALEKLEVTWAGAAGGINAMGKARRAASQDVGGKLISLSTVESDFGLQGAERKVGRALETVAGVSGAQAASENIVLADTLGYQALNARAAKDALIQRSQLLEDSQTASKTAITKRRNVERLKGSSNINPAKVDDAIAEMDDANALESTLSRQLQAISTNLHLSLRQHSRYTHEDAAMALLENARLSVAFQKQALREMEIARAELGRVGGGDVYGAKAQGQAQPHPQAQSQNSAPYQGQASQQRGVGQPPRNDGPSSHAQPQVQIQPQPAQQHQALPRQPIHTQAPAQQPGTQSMFLPSQHQQRQAQQQQRSSFDPRQQQNGSPFAQDPSHARRPQSQYHEQQQQQAHAGMAQSMVIPPSHVHPQGPAQPPGGQQGQRTMGRGGRRLDERQAARMLAGGF